MAAKRKLRAGVRATLCTDLWWGASGGLCRWESGVTVSPALPLGTWAFLAPARPLLVSPLRPFGLESPCPCRPSLLAQLFGPGPLEPCQFAQLSDTFPLVLLHVHFSSTHHKEFAPSWEGRTEGEAPVCMTPMWAWNLPVRATGQALCLDGLCSPEPGTEWLPSAGRPVDIRALRVARWCSEGRSPWAAGVREVPRGSGQV